jgi:medium-chain acyl-[acyl-carrier-protein] hydrolase
VSTFDQPSRWVASFGRRNAPKQRLLCLPYAGGSCTIFRNWARVLPPDVEVLPIQLPGRGARHQERPPSSIEETSAQLSEAITPFLDRPYMIFGHCVGALIALELARFLDARSLRPPSALFVAARPEPQALDFDPQVSGLSDPDLTQALRNLNSTPSEIIDDGRLLRLLLPTIRADFLLVERYSYVPGIRLRCPVIAIAGTRDRVTPAQIEGWRHVTDGPFTTHWIEGNHFFIHENEAELLGLMVTEVSKIGEPAP